MQDPDRNLTPELLLRAYAVGVFPMAESREDPELFWVDPRHRGIIPLSGFHVSRSLARRLRRGDYEITVNRDFTGVVAACADRAETWINARIAALYEALHRMGHAHSLEVWQNDALAGGVYGVTLGTAFFGESMFSRRRDGSKIALAYLVARLRAGGFTLFDTQFLTPHLASMGGVEVPRSEYRHRLAQALEGAADFEAPRTPAPAEVVQLATKAPEGA